MKHSVKIYIPVWLLLVTLACASCKKEQAPTVLNVTNGLTSIAVTNASTEIQQLKFFMDNQALLLPDTALAPGYTSYTLDQAAAYANNPSRKVPYLSLASGYRQLNFGVPDSRNYIAARNDYFACNKKYSVFITDSIRHGQAQCVVLRDSLQIPDSNWAQIRFVNLSPESPPMDVYVFYDAGTTGSRLFTDREYLPTHPSTIEEAQRFARIKSGPYYFYATISGTKRLLLEGGLILPPRSVTTIYAMGWLQGVGRSSLDVGVIRYIQ